jgi:transposase-like protein
MEDCPKCKSDDIVFIGWKDAYGIFFREYECKKCKHSWHENPTIEDKREFSGNY